MRSEGIRNGVRFSKVARAWVLNWLAFFITLSVFAVVWFAGKWAISRLGWEANGFYLKMTCLSFFAAAILMVGNEVKMTRSYRAERIRIRQGCPKLWDAVKAVSPAFSWFRTRLYLMPSEEITAMTFGCPLPGMSAIFVSQGMLENLNAEELDAVIAHELTHVINADGFAHSLLILIVESFGILGSVTMMAGLATLGKILFLGDKTPNAFSGLGHFGVGICFASLGFFLGPQMVAYVSRRREFAADAVASLVVGTSAYLIGALVKIASVPFLIITSDYGSVIFRYFLVRKPSKKLVDSLHPSIGARIQALLDLER